MKFRLALFLVAGIVAGLIIFASKLSKPLPAPFAESSVEKTPPIEEQMRATLEPPPLAPAVTPGEAAAPEFQLAPKLDLARGKLAWEEQIESVANAPDLDDTAKARRLLAMLPILPEQGLATAAEEAIARLPDADYSAVGLPFVVNPQTHGLVAGVLFADLMERPDAIALPALLRIAQTPQHPYSPHARDNLELLLGKNFGSDWQKWSAEIHRSLSGQMSAP